LTRFIAYETIFAVPHTIKTDGPHRPIAADLRSYIEQLKNLHEVQEINQEVDWNLEIGGIMRRASDYMAPAPLFNRIKGYPAGFRVFGSSVNASSRKNHFHVRIATSLGLRPDAPAAEIIETLATLRNVKGLAPKLVATGPCKENILTGDQVDLFKLPVPYLHNGDGGRYLGTWHTVITQTPDQSWTNWGMYRLMVHDRNTMGGSIVPTQHIGMQFDAWRKLNRDMPFAVAIGTDPVTPIVSAMGIPPYVNEADVIGGYRGTPMELVVCETVPLQVPASAEIVIEGTVSATESRAEGPFGEYTGYLTAGRGPKPVYQVTAITHRHNPILTCVCPGEPVEDHLSMSLTLAAEVLYELRQSNLPVVMTYIPPYSSLHVLAISLDKSAFKGSDAELIQQIAQTLWHTKAGMFIPKVIVVNQDVDATDVNKVMWAFATRNHPGTGVHAFPDTSVFPLFPFLSPEERQARKCTTLIFDCTWPSTWSPESVPRNASFEALWPKELQEKIKANWTSYGYAEPD
jgi:4-hydroxy-3-polyprenylbenzoate decarboxylase